MRPTALRHRRLAMGYIGLDVHLYTSTLHVLDRCGGDLETVTIKGGWPCCRSAWPRYSIDWIATEPGTTSIARIRRLTVVGPTRPERASSCPSRRRFEPPIRIRSPSTLKSDPIAVTHTCRSSRSGWSEGRWRDQTTSWYGRSPRDCCLARVPRTSFRAHLQHEVRASS